MVVRMIQLQDPKTQVPTQTWNIKNLHKIENKKEKGKIDQMQYNANISQREK